MQIQNIDEIKKCNLMMAEALDRIRKESFPSRPSPDPEGFAEQKRELDEFCREFAWILKDKARDPEKHFKTYDAWKEWFQEIVTTVRTLGCVENVLDEVFGGSLPVDEL